MNISFPLIIINKIQNKYDNNILTIKKEILLILLEE